MMNTVVFDIDTLGRRVGDFGGALETGVEGGVIALGGALDEGNDAG